MVPRSRGDARGGLDEVVALLDQQVRAEHRGELAQRRQLLARSPSIGSRGGFTQSRSRSVPSRCAERQARRTRRCELGLRPDQRQQPLADRLRRGVVEQPVSSRGAERSRRRQALGLDLLGDLAQRDLAQRREVLDPEEVVERRLDALAGVDLARRAGARSAPRA